MLQQMDRALKERIIGAAVLVVFAVLVVPVFLDGPDDGAEMIIDAAGGDSGNTEDEVRVVLGSASPGQTLSVTATFDDVNMVQPTDGGDDCGDGCTAARDGVLSLPFDAIAMVDINGDGIVDLLMTDESGGVNASVLYWVCGRDAGTSE